MTYLNKEWPNRVNIVNFIRGVEPRLDIDLLETLREELALVRKHGLPATWLIQYDALIDDNFVALLKQETDEKQEIGAWFEVVQPLVEKAGLVWRGRYAWDWHAHVGFSIGYTPEERERLADVFMEEFRAKFGRYPKSVGSWFIDAHLLGYLADRYAIVASCNCKDQWGTDGYTLWGGYYNQAYYPSRLNGFMPAQTAANQIPVPVFRMLGSDPIYQYDAADHGHGQTVVTLEPVYTGNEGGGGLPSWVRWFFDVSFRPAQLSFGYAQIGQENSFGWERIGAGLTDQIDLLAQKREQGELVVETLAASGAWFKSRYPLTPASAICALEDWKNEGRQSVWYYNRNYRVNLFREKEHFRIRDIHLFDETYEERYLRDVCATEDCRYDTLPVMDGARWNDFRTRTGIEPILFDPSGHARPAPVVSLKVDDTVTGELEVELLLEGGGSIAIRCAETAITFRSALDNWGLRMAWGDTAEQPDLQAAADGIHYRFFGHSYDVRMEGAYSLAYDRKLDSPEAQENDEPANAIAIRPLDRELKWILAR